MSLVEIHHPEETLRLKDLRNLQILDTPIEERFERITRLVQRTFGVPMCAISCVDEHRQWFKSIQGLAVAETARCVSFCQHTVLQDDAFVINDARVDERFKESPLVTGNPNMVFYAGTQIYSKNHIPIASLCVMDSEPRDFDADEIEMLSDFARMVESEMHAASPNDVHDELVHAISHSWRVTLVDPLTRLWNTEGIVSVLDGHLVSNTSRKSQMCLAMIDLKGFFEINTRLGHVAGDTALRSFAKHLLQHVEREHIVGRMQGNTFCVLLNNITDEFQLESKLRHLQSLVDTFPITGIQDRKTIGGSIAAITVPTDWNGSSESLINQLGEAMHSTKASRSSGGIDQPTICQAVDQQSYVARDC